MACRREERVQKAFSVDHHGPGDARLSHSASRVYGAKFDYVGDGLEAPGHVQSYRRVSFADQPGEQGPPGRGPLERGASAVAGGAVGTHWQPSCAPPYFGLEDQGLGCTPAPRSGGTLNPTRSLSRGRPGDIGAHPEEWGTGSVRPMPGLGGPEGRDLRMAAPPHALGRRRASGEHPFRGQ